MRIDVDHQAVQGLCGYWKLAADWTDLRRDLYGKTLRADLAASVAKIALPHGGQLALTYQEFLSMKPSGVHSSAHGSEMHSQTVYWVTVARLPRQVSLERIKGSSSVHQIGQNGPKVCFNTPERFFFPVRWKRQLWPIYPGSSCRPSFTLERPEKKPDEAVDEKSLNIGALGEHLFRISPPGKLDWATKICVVVGTRAVKLWLIDHQSTETYEKLRSRPEFR